MFGLGTDALAEPVPPYPFTSDDAKINAFEQWLRDQIETGPLEVVSPDNNEFIRSAYRRGLTHADKELKNAGLTVAVTGTDVSAPEVFNQGVHRSQLQRLYTRNFENLEGIGADVADEIREELAEGLARGEGPRRTAAFINDRIDAVGRYRSTVLARTEVINSFSDATLNRFEQFNASGVTVRTEWLATNDRRTCPICENLDGNVYTIEQARTATFRFDGRDYPVKPPAHPQCRCSLSPVIDT